MFTLPLHISTFAQWLEPLLGCVVEDKSNYNIYIRGVGPILFISVFYSFFIYKNFPLKIIIKKII
jgi:hypothetical protein